MADGYRDLLKKMYQQRPDLFTESERAYLEGPREVTLTPEAQEDANIGRMISQFAGGFAAGFTALPSSVFSDAPESEYEAIANEMGHLAGFIGLFPGIGTIGSLGVKGISLGAKALQLGSAVQGVRRFAMAEKALSSASKGLGLLANPVSHFRSMPLLAGDVALGWLERRAPAKIAESYLMKSATGKLAIAGGKQAFHLGVASAFSEASYLVFDDKKLGETVTDAMHAAAYGGLFGGIFGAGVGSLWKIKGLDQGSTAATALRSIAGSLAQGLPSTVGGQSTEQQIYAYLMGGVFGAYSPSPERYIAGRAIQKLSDKPFALANFSDPAWDTVTEYSRLSPDVQKQARDMLEEYFKPQSTRMALTWILAQFGRDSGLSIEKLSTMTPEELMMRFNKPYSGKTGDKVVIEEAIDPVTGEATSPIATVTEVNREGTSIRVRFDDGTQGTYGNWRIRPLRKTTDNKKTQPIDIANAERNDFEPLISTPGSRSMIAGAMSKFGKDRVTDAELAEYGKAFDEIVNLPEVPVDGYREKIRELTFGAKPETALDPVEHATLNSLAQAFYGKKYGISREVGHFDKERGFVIDKPLDPSYGVVYDANNNRISVLGPPEWREGIVNITWVRDPGSSNEVTTFPRLEMTEGTMGSLLQSALKTGFIPYGADADKGNLMFVRARIPTDPEAYWTRLTEVLKKVDPGWEAYWANVRERDSRMGLDEAYSRTAMMSRMMDKELFTFGRLDETGVNLTRLLGQNKPVSGVISIKEFDEFKKVFSDVYDTFTPEGSRRLFSKEAYNRFLKGENRVVAPKKERKGSEWVDVDLAMDVVEPDPKMFKDYGEWATYRGWMARLRDIIEPIEGEHAATFMTRQASLAYERMLAEKSPRYSGVGFLHDLAADNKRNQQMHHRFYQAHPEMLPALEADVLRSMRVIVIHDHQDNVLTADRMQVGKEASDGSAWWSRKIQQLMAKLSGHDQTEEALKVFIQHRDPENGTGLYKPLMNVASKELTEQFAKMFPGEEIVLLPISSAKQYGGREVYHLHMNGEKPVFFNEAGEMVMPKRYALDPLDIGIAFSVKDPPVKNWIALSKSVMTAARRFELGEEGMSALQDLVDMSFVGLPESNDLFRKYITDPTDVNLKALDGHFDTIDKRMLLSQVKIDPALKNRLLRFIYLHDTRGRKDYIAEGDDAMDAVDWEVAIREAYGDKRWVALTDGDADLLTINKSTKDIVEDTIKSFILEGATRPWLNGAKSMIGTRDPLEIRQYNKSEGIGKFYLGNWWKKFIIQNGVNLLGERESMTLEKQFKLLQELRERKPTGWEKWTEEIKEVLRDVVQRDPMDDSTGMVLLEFGGFSGRPGNGILLDDAHFKRLSGMDADGDTANIYFNMPTPVKYAITRLESLFNEAQTYYPDGQKLWFSEDNPMIKMAGSMSAKADPIAAIEIGWEVSRGRGELMAWHSAVKHTLRTLIDNAEGGEYRSPIYSGRRYRTDAEVRFIPKTNQIAASKLMSDGSHVFVDVAKLGTKLPTRDDITLLDLAATMDYIVIKRRTGEEIIDLRNSISERGDKLTLPKETVDKLMGFIKNTLWHTDFGIIRETNKKFYRTNDIERRPFTMAEVTEVASRYPFKVSDLLGTIANNVKGLDYSEGLLHRVLPYYKNFIGNMWQWDRETYKKTEKKSFLPFTHQMTPYFRGMLQKLEIIKMGYRPDSPGLPKNWATESGIWSYVKTESRHKGSAMRRIYADLFTTAAEEHMFRVNSANSRFERDRLSKLKEAFTGPGGEKMAVEELKTKPMPPPLDNGFSMQDYLYLMDESITRSFRNTAQQLDGKARAELDSIFLKGYDELVKKFKGDPQIDWKKYSPDERARFHKMRKDLKKKTVKELSRDDIVRAVDVVFDARGAFSDVNRVRYLRGIISQTEDFLISRFHDLAGIENMYASYKNNRIGPEFSKIITRELKKIKENYSTYRSARKSRKMLEREAEREGWDKAILEMKIAELDKESDRLHSLYGTPEAVETQVNALIDMMVAKSKAYTQDGKTAPSEAGIKDFIWTVFASSIDPFTGKTRLSQRIDDMIPPEIMMRRLTSARKLFKAFETKPDPKKFKEHWQEVEQSIAGYHELVRQYDTVNAIERTLIPELQRISGSNVIPEKTMVMAREIVDILRSVAVKDPLDETGAMEALRSLSGKAQIRDMNYQDLVGIRNTLVGFKIGPGMIRWMLRGGVDQWRPWVEKMKREGKSLSWLDKLGFIGTTAQGSTVNDMTFLDKRIWDDAGELTADRVAFPTTRPGRVDYVYSNAKVPISTMHRMVEVNRMLAIAPEQVDIMDNQELEKQLQKFTRVLDSANVDRFEELSELAVRLREYEGQQRVVMSLIDKTTEHYKKQEADLREYQRRHLDGSKKYNEIKDKIFTLPGHGTLKGSEIVRELATAQQKFMDWIFQNKIAFDPVRDKIWFPMNRSKLSVDVNAMLRLWQPLIREQVVRTQIPSDVVRAMEFAHKAEMYVRDNGDEIMLPTVEAVEKIQYGEPIAELRKHKSSFAPVNRAEAHVWIRNFMNKIRHPEWKGMDEDIRDPGMARMAKEGYKAAEGVLADMGEVRDKDIYKHETVRRVLDAQNYFRRFLDPNLEVPSLSDVRTMLFGMGEYSQYEMDLRAAKGQVNKHDWLIQKYMDENSYRNTGYTEGYWPHLDWDIGRVRKSINERMQMIQSDVNTESSVKEQKLQELVEYQNRILGMDVEYDGLDWHTSMKEEHVQPVKTKVERSLDLEASRSPNELHREFNLDGYSYSIDALKKYMQRINRSTYKRLGLMVNRHLIRDFELRAPMGPKTKEWADWMRVYVRTSLGGPSLFTAEMLSDPTFALKSTPYYWLSDHVWGKAGLKIHRAYLKLSGADIITPVERALFKAQKGRDPYPSELKAMKESKARKLTQTTGPEGEENMLRASRILHNFSLWEGRYEMMTLLAHSKTAVANILGGTINDWVYNGAKAMIAARDIKEWQKIGPLDENGLPLWKTIQDVHKSFFTQGIIEDFITKEAAMISDGKGDWDGFTKALTQKLTKDLAAPDATIRELVKQYKITQGIMDKASWFMRVSERQLRINAGLAAYLNARRAMEPMTYLEWNNPYLLDVMKQSIASSQFLYGAETRPVWAATNMGKVYSRFKLWAWSSVKYRRLVWEAGRNVGYAVGSPEMKRFERMMAADLFLLGLASLLPNTILDYGLPAPLSYFQNMADWMFGDDKERERAFFIRNTGLPAALAPFNELFPPITRLPKGVADLDETFNILWGGDVNKLGEYTTYSIFPFGRLTKDMLRALDNPDIAQDVLVGIPLKRLGQTKTKLKKNSRDDFKPWK